MLDIKFVWWHRKIKRYCVCITFNFLSVKYKYFIRSIKEKLNFVTLYALSNYSNVYLTPDYSIVAEIVQRWNEVYIFVGYDKDMLTPLIVLNGIYLTSKAFKIFRNIRLVIKNIEHIYSQYKTKIPIKCIRYTFSIYRNIFL